MIAENQCWRCLTYPNTSNRNSESNPEVFLYTIFMACKKNLQQLAIMCKNDYHGDYEHMYEYVCEQEISSYSTFLGRLIPGSSRTLCEHRAAKSQTKTDRPLTSRWRDADAKKAPLGHRFGTAATAFTSARMGGKYYAVQFILDRSTYTHCGSIHWTVIGDIRDADETCNV